MKGIASILIPPENVYGKWQREYNYAASLLTDSTGYVVQALSYLPYGEEWTEYNEMQRPDSLSLGQYRFNGKERDPESGFLYYGQRYYGISYIPMWLSVDPMTDKYPGISPYHYCHWNPIRLIDPDGMEDWEVDQLGRITKCKVQPENPTEDRIRVKGTEGWTEKNSLSGLTRGTISEQKRWNFQNEAQGSLVLLGGNRQDRISLFEFCADNSEVEFSLIELDNNASQYFLLTTSHDIRSVGKEKYGDELGSAISISNAASLRLHIHNHFGNGQYGWGPSADDISFKKHITDKQKSFWSGQPGNGISSTEFGIYKCRGSGRKIISY